MTIPELEAIIADLKSQNQPFHNPVMEIHKKFSIPVACFVFALLGVGLGVSNRKDGRLASFVLGTAVIFVYYVVMFTAQSMTQGALLPPSLAMWLPNILLGLAGIVLVISRSRGIDSLRFKLPALPRRRAAAAAGASDGDRAAAAGYGRRAGRTVIVIRIPQFQLPRPNLLDLYVARAYLRMLIICIIGILGLFYISTFIDLSDKLFKGQASLGMIMAFLWWKTPQFLYYIIAIAVLMAAIVTIGALTRNSELIVMRACGISIYRTALPLLVFAMAASAVLFGFEERLLAISNRRADFLRHVIRGGDPRTFDQVNRRWIVGRDGEIYHYQAFDPVRREFHGLSVFRFEPATHTLTQRVYAADASYTPTAADNRVWTARTGWIRDFAGPNVTGYRLLAGSALTLEPSDYFVTEAPEPDRMNFEQLRNYIAELRASGYTVLEHEVALYRKFAFPMVTLIMTLIAVPFAVTVGKGGAMYGVGIGIALALVYWTAISGFVAFGAGGLLPPMLAAWAPNLLFGASAAYLLLTVRT